MLSPAEHLVAFLYQVTQGIDPEAATTALAEVALELEAARKKVAELEAR